MKLIVKATHSVLTHLSINPLCSKERINRSNTVKEFRLLLKMYMNSCRKTKRRNYLDNVRLNYKK